MAGLFGLINAQVTVDPHEFMDVAGKTMCHQPWNEIETYVHPDNIFGIGRISLGIFNRESQPFVAKDGTCLVWLCGELYKTDELARKIKVVFPAKNISDLELIAAAYQEFGLDFAQHLNGAFFIVLYDISQRKFIMANDRYGLYPHYYHFSSRELVFAPEVKGVLCAKGIDRKPDLTAACEYIRFQQLLGERTFHEGIHLFPYGSVAQYEMTTGEWRFRRYWDWDQIEYHPEINFDQAVEEVGSILTRTVSRLVGGYRPGIFLSGGLDSRTLLGLVSPDVPTPITATFGARNCRDVIYAEKIARACGSRHYWFDLPNGNWVRENLDLHFQLTEGFHSWLHMHGITMYKDLRPMMDVNLSGWDGGSVIGHKDTVNSLFNYPVDREALTLHAYQKFCQEYTWPGLTDVEEHQLFTPEFRKEAQWRAFASFSDQFSRFWNMRQELAGEFFYMVNHCCRLTNHMITNQRSSIEARFPYWDYDLIDFIYSLKPELRRDQMILRTIITRKLPRLAIIPHDKNEYLPSVQPMLHGLQKMGMRTLKRLKIIPERPLLYADYENYLRNELRDWAEDLLFSPRTAQRNMFNMEFVHSLMNRHLAKNENWVIGKIAPLITYEMVMREFFD